jgi:hypothetical protein
MSLIMSTTPLVARHELIETILLRGPHEDVVFKRSDIPHPLDMGFELAVGAPHGQAADYRLELADGRGIHIRDMRTGWAAHWDHMHPTLSRWWDHLANDAPEWAFVVAIILMVAFIVAIALVVRAVGKARE